MELDSPTQPRTALQNHTISGPPRGVLLANSQDGGRAAVGSERPKKGLGRACSRLPVQQPRARAWKETRHPGAAPVQFLPQRRKRRARGRTVPTIFSTSYQNSLVNSLKSHRSECDIKYIPYISYVSLFYY